MNRLMQDDMDYQTRHLEELATCNSVGKFERYGDRDIAFVCNFSHMIYPSQKLHTKAMSRSP